VEWKKTLICVEGLVHLEPNPHGVTTAWEMFCSSSSALVMKAFPPRGMIHEHFLPEHMTR
jgi:hypothetical protein